ncbi:unnamed protein product [Cuscuta europaea]|uniref:Uncharacterized protein n=1 Tax=Cuscuta europaea TaxID=41803 RepID=A0A9P0YKD0_CUSEU|nr:unnamed protein product [Cuscuta europaea]
MLDSDTCQASDGRGSHQSGWHRQLHVAALDAVVGCDVCTWYDDPGACGEEILSRRVPSAEGCWAEGSPNRGSPCAEGCICRRLGFHVLFSCNVSELDSVNGSLRSWGRRHPHSVMWAA